MNRTQFASIFADEDYKSAIEYADSLQREIYEADAKTIDNIQKGILAISQKEKPFDVFICYKETDNAGRRTPDSVLANDLYHQLTQEGLKVFFSRKTLEDKIGEAYEPYIFAALNSAKVMVVLGTRPEYFKAVGVRNEWSRFLSQIKAGAKKSLVPAYKDMDPYDLPDEFSNLQAQDMSKLGFMQDLIRGIKKLTEKEEPKPVVIKETKVVTNVVNNGAEQLLKRAKLALEDAEFSKSDEFCEQALNIDAENAEAYLIKLFVEFKVTSIEKLRDLKEPFDNSKNYKKAIRFADKETKNKLDSCLSKIKQILEEEERIKKEKEIEIERQKRQEEEKKEKCPLSIKKVIHDDIFIFKGRLSGDEFLLSYLLFLVILTILFTIIFSMSIGTNVGLFGLLALLALFYVFPAILGIVCRRLHDFGFSGLWSILTIPLIVCMFVIDVWLVKNVVDYVDDYVLHYLMQNNYSYSDIYYPSNLSTIKMIIFFISFLFFNLLSGYLFSRILGNREENKYGAPRSKLRIDSNSKILVFLVKVLRICHLIKQEDDNEKLQQENFKIKIGVVIAFILLISIGIKIYENKKIQSIISTSILENMVKCPAGSFVMGSPSNELGKRTSEFASFTSDDETQHIVTISKPFYIGKYEVTQKEYEAVMGRNFSQFKGENNPVEVVSWDNAMDFCDKLNKYAKNIPHGYKFDLPTEAQWEYACRAGTTTSLNSGKNITSEEGSCYNLDEVGWYAGNSGSKTHPVGQKKPNAWGIYDMHGNVEEWCKDVIKGYPSFSVTDPIYCVDIGGMDRVIRGGSWNSTTRKCRSANRQSGSPSFPIRYYGFRLALVPVD